jgi:8-hydroxy-5-deazaflavin:NADPH oxidoreductase
MADERPTIAVLGGTGDLGSGLAYRWVSAGYSVILGSRSEERAEAAAAAIAAEIGGSITGKGNKDAASSADIVVLTVPYANQRPSLEEVKAEVQGKILVDVTVPLSPPKVARVNLPEEGSAGKAAQLFLGEDVRVVSAFQNVAAAHLRDLDHVIDCDVLVSGNDPAARELVVALVEAANMRGWHAGPIDNAVVAEALTSVLIHMNRRYKIAGAGIRITGESKAESK